MKRLKKVALLIMVALLFVVLAAGLTGCGRKVEEAVTLNVSASATFTDVLKEINDRYMERQPGVTITAHFASAGTIQTQIEQGAPCDVFLSAGARQMDNLQNGGLILDDTRKDLLRNTIVLTVPRHSTLRLSDFASLTGANVSRVAIGDPVSVSSGMYGKQALEQLGVYSQLKSKLILCSDVRAVLTYVENGDVDAGIVYRTDALISDRVELAAEGPAEVNATIVYPVAVIKASKDPDAARRYLDFLSGEEARAVFEEYGFASVEG